MSETENVASGSTLNVKPEDIGLCEHCVTGAKLSGTPKGVFMNTTPLPTYVATAGTRADHAISSATNAEGAEGATASGGSKSTFTPGSAKALVIIPDIFGFSLPNPQLLADIFAEQCGIDVWAVDIFNGK
jgi:hypothetical protein